jgi:hypothetical protein
MQPTLIMPQINQNLMLCENEELDNPFVQYNAMNLCFPFAGFSKQD